MSVLNFLMTEKFSFEYKILQKLFKLQLLTNMMLWGKLISKSGFLVKKQSSNNRQQTSFEVSSSSRTTRTIRIEMSERF